MKKRPPNPFIWDGASQQDDDEDVRSICITASASSLRFAAGFLLDYALRFPDQSLDADTDRPLLGENRLIQRYLHDIGQQLLTTLECGGGDMPYLLRQNPILPCLLEQSTDDGSTWTLVYDFTKCIPDSPTTIINHFSTQVDGIAYYVTNYQNNYTSDITDLYPDLGYDTSPDDDLRNIALCHAVKVMVDSLCEAAMKTYDELDGMLNTVKIGAAIAAGIAAIIGLAGSGGAASPALAALAGDAALWAAGIALGATIGEGLYNIVTTYPREVFTNPDYRQEVVCAVYLVLKGSNANRDVFQNALDGIVFDEETTEAIGLWVQMMMQEVPVYAAFVEQMEAAMRSARAGLLEDCECDNPAEANITLVDTFPGTFNHNPTFISNTLDGGSIWECTTVNPAPGAFFVAVSSQRLGVSVPCILVSASPVITYQHRKEDTALTSGTGDGNTAETGFNYIDLGFNTISHPVTITIEIKPLP